MAPKTTPIQHWILGLCFKNKEKTGTSTIYNAVIKALLLAVVNTSPTCWNVAPQNRNVPQQIPPSRSSFFCFFCSSGVQTLFVSAGRFCFLFPSIKNVTGIKTSVARKKREPLNVKGPMYSMPTRCATKANPQIKAVSKRRPLASIRLFLT